MISKQKELGYGKGFPQPLKFNCSQCQKKFEIKENEGHELNNYNKTRSQITKLNIYRESLRGSLNLEGFVNLKEFRCSNNKLTNLNLSSGNNLEKLNCYYNKLTNLNFLNNLNEEKLTVLSIGNNNFPESDLTPFSKFTNLEELYLGGNNFTGSLKPLAGMTKLKKLTISDTNIDSGLEYLPDSVEDFSLISSLPPYPDLAHDFDLAMKICEGLRPRFKVKIPQLLKELIERFKNKSNTEFVQQFKEREQFLNNLTSVDYKVHPSAVYTSRLLDFKNLPKPQNSKEINEQFYSQFCPIGSRQVDLEIPASFGQLNSDQELANRTKRQLSLDSQTKTNQGESKQQKVFEEQSYQTAEPMEIDKSNQQTAQTLQTNLPKGGNYE
ncbi:7399_t:CDS:2 [Scutellospora calospora]|uniref:7399_t:CDS:1 n=1 Tax=Scutellospora calospora TaxID=85575 RepID=A0ACA9KN00_9GLOM|nr:7399_t:CDS:2 [Scutellospora calospora]